jgi:outer membrane biosynthesis protein TonB
MTSGSSSPSGDKHALDVALDLLVYAPVGFALEARELFPKLADRGRGQVTIVRLIGRFALQKSQQEADRLLSKVRPGASASPSTSRPAANAPAATAPDPATAANDAPPPPASPSTPPVARAKPKAARTAPVARAIPRRTIKPPAKAPGVAKKTAAKKPATKATPTKTTPGAKKATSKRASPRPASTAPLTSATLAIPSYDTLSASQVIPRLDSLRPDELQQVRSYEAAHRGRRTILSRVAQLQG